MAKLYSEVTTDSLLPQIFSYYGVTTDNFLPQILQQNSKKTDIKRNTANDVILLLTQFNNAKTANENEKKMPIMIFYYKMIISAKEIGDNMTPSTLLFEQQSSGPEIFFSNYRKDTSQRF